MKPRDNKLDAYAEQLRECEAAGQTIAQIRERLAALGCSSSSGSISEYLKRLRSQAERQQVEANQLAMQERVLVQIAQGADDSKAFARQFTQTNAPAVAALVELHRLINMKLAVKAVALDDPELMALARDQMKPVLDYAKLEAQREQFAAEEKRKADEREIKKTQVTIEQEKLKLLQRKADAYDRAQKALTEVRSSGGITPETLKKIEGELKLL